MKQRFTVSLFFSTAVLVSLLCIISCADSAPVVSSAVHTIVYDYFDEKKPPQVRFSVFVNPESDIVRLSHMQVSSEDTNLSWLIEEPEILTYSGKTYAGCSVLMYQNPLDIASEKYTVSYIDAAQRSDEISFSVEVPSSFAGKDPSSYAVSDIDSRKVCPEFIHERVILYGEDGSVVYYGSKTTNLRDPALIRKTYKTAVSMRRYLLVPGNRAGILLPPVMLPEYIPSEDEIKAPAEDQVPEDAVNDEQTADEQLPVRQPNDGARGDGAMNAGAQNEGSQNDVNRKNNITGNVPPPPVRGTEPASGRNVPPPMRSGDPAADRNVPPPPPLRAGDPAADRNAPPPPMRAGDPAADRNVPPPPLRSVTGSSGD